ncbi:MAG: hypothetical protein J7L53_08740 [Deltaproteobacteria bacterium]|nr:hypothetical protein [Deltaproteobacteria bacterium]
MKRCTLVLALATFMVCGFTLLSPAATFKIGDIDWSLGGSVRLDAGYQFSDLGDQALISSSSLLTYPEDSQTDFFLENPGNSRIRLKAQYDEMIGYVEVGLDSSKVKLRHAYAKYDMDDEYSLLVGQTYSITAEESAALRLNKDNGLAGVGNLDLSRNPMICFTRCAGNLTFKFAIEDNDVLTPSGLDESKYVVNQLTPAILARIDYENDMMRITPSILWQRYEMKGNAYGLSNIQYKDINVSGWVIALDSEFKLEQVRFQYECWYGQNIAVFAGIDKRPRHSTDFGAPVARTPVAGDASTDIEDVKSFGGWGQFKIPLDPVTVYLGAGYQQADVEPEDQTKKPYYESEISTWGAFINCKYNLVKGFYIQPEVAYFNWGNDAPKTPEDHKTGDNDLGSDIFVGVHFQYDF